MRQWQEDLFVHTQVQVHTLTLAKASKILAHMHTHPCIHKIRQTTTFRDILHRQLGDVQTGI